MPNDNTQLFYTIFLQMLKACYNDSTDSYCTTYKFVFVPINHVLQLNKNILYHTNFCLWAHTLD